MDLMTTAGKIDTAALGLVQQWGLIAFTNPPVHVLKFDTGIVMHIPSPMVEIMNFHLEDTP